VRDWVIRYDKQSTDGLSDRPHGGGASPKLSVEEKAQLACRVRQGPDITEDSLYAGGYATCGTASWRASSW
jgi:transposase